MLTTLLLMQLTWSPTTPPEAGSLGKMSSPTRLLMSETLLAGDRKGDYVVTLKEPPPKTSWSEAVDGEPAGFWLREEKNGEPTGLWFILIPSAPGSLHFGVRRVVTLPFNDPPLQALIRSDPPLKFMRQTGLVPTP